MPAAPGRPNASTITEWSMTNSVGMSGLIRALSPPSCVMASRMATRSTTQGTPVKSCINTRAGLNDTSAAGMARGSHPATASTCAWVTVCPSAWRSRFSNSTFRL